MPGRISIKKYFYYYLDRIGGMGVIMQDNNTIAGIASGMGGGIGIIRISGDKALEAAGRIFRGVWLRNLTGRTACHGFRR